MEEAKSKSWAGTTGNSNPPATGNTKNTANPADSNAEKPPTLAIPSITLPKGGGAIRGIEEKFNADTITGAGSVTIPITTSPGRAGFGPQLSLAYSSGGGNGIFGLGFSLSLPSITRKTDKGIPQYQDADESDVFLLSNAEDLVPVSETNGTHFVDVSSMPGYTIHRYRPRIEGLFSRIERLTRDDGDVHWRSISKDNILTIYGKDEESRISDPEYPSHVFSWMICETRDDKGNAVIYKYKAEDGTNVNLASSHERNRGPRNDASRKANRHLKRVLYGNRVSQLDSAGKRPHLLSSDDVDKAGWVFEVVLDYGEHSMLNPKPNDPGSWTCRSDPFSAYRSGFEIRTYRLCQRVLMFHHFPEESDVGQDCLVRSTNLSYHDYSQSGSAIYSFISSVLQTSYRRTASGVYTAKSLPPVEFEYSPALVHNKVREVDEKSLENIPIGIDDSLYKWTDLDGEGLSGVLTEQGGAWFYKRNTSPTNFVKDGDQESVNARFQSVKVLPEIPNTTTNNNQAQFMDLSGDSQLDLIQLNGPVRGFYTRTADSSWTNFQAFKSWPNLDNHDPRFHLVDLTGDGLADILLTEDDALTWHSSLGKDGFGPATRLSLLLDEEKGPRVLFNENTQSVQLSDLSGDGLADLVRIRNGDISYWPNLGYGRFGAKVAMDNAPWFDFVDTFSPNRIKLADIDGSGSTDIIYLGTKKIDVYFNQAGNGWAPKISLDLFFPSIDALSSAQALDLLGNGTSCLVWSSSLPGHARHPVQYIDLMGGEKPHLMRKIINNMGSETHVRYAPSTKFYLEDEAAGNPWVTKLPIVVHVVDRVDTVDLISKNRFVTAYKYHHGFYDGIEREFRGFGMVEQLDTETLAVLSSNASLSDGTNIAKSSHVPPILSRTWFHTGAYLDRNNISKHFEHEYYREDDQSELISGLSDAEYRPLLLDDTILPAEIHHPDGTIMPFELTDDDRREACRSLKGTILRQEVYALDGTDKEDRPYSTSERNFTIKLLQPLGQNKHSVFFTHPRETINANYERKLVEVAGRKVADPRISHSITLAVDYFGTVLRSMHICYRRRDLPGVDLVEQQQTHVVLSSAKIINAINEKDWQRIGLPAEKRTYEVVKPPEPDISNGRVIPFSFSAMSELTQNLFPPGQDDPDPAVLWPYQKWDWRENPANAPSTASLRLVERRLTIYRMNDLSGPCPYGQVESLGLPFETYRLAFTPEMAKEIYVDSGKLTTQSLDAALIEGKYVHVSGDKNWWVSTGKIFYSPNGTDTPFEELNYARQHFFLGRRHRDPFHSDAKSTEVVISFDKYDLLMTESRDALGNVTTVGERDAAGNVVTNKPGNDYRILQPVLTTDPNRNRTQASVDTLGNVIATAVKGKDDTVGDTLDGFEPDMTQAQVDDLLNAADVQPVAQALIKGATTRIIYDHTRFYRSKVEHPDDSSKWLPTFTASLTRETHVSDLIPLQASRILVAFSFSDGFGREVQKKVQAEPGPLIDGGPSVDVRWVGRGWTIFNNKGKPVRQYEPFFSRTHDFEFAVQVGVSATTFYDPVERVIATLRPNHTFEKIVFDPWEQSTYDPNDTVAINPVNDPDVGGFFRRIPSAEYAPTWYEQRVNGGLGTQEQQAAEKAFVHANTPTTADFDAMERFFNTTSHNKMQYSDAVSGGPIEEIYRSRVVFDVEGNKREIFDAKDRLVMRAVTDMLSTPILQSSMEAGERWTLKDTAGKPLYGWDSRGHQTRTVYDQLQRPIESRLRTTNGPELLVGRTVYGESEADPEAANLREKPIKVFDQAGVVMNTPYDFKGNLLSSVRQLAVEYKATRDWTNEVALETSTYTSHTVYDALNRPTEATLPDNTVIRTTYNEASLPDKLDANLHGAAELSPFITNINYNARRQREAVGYGNGVATTFIHDPLTFRLSQILTKRNSVNFPGDQPGQVQNLKYTYDPVGNITHIRDGSQQTVYFRNTVVAPSNEYTYDAKYRLIEATGREHLGQSNGTRNAPTPTTSFSGDISHDNPNDGNAMGTYLERYLYDAVGNIQAMKHLGSDPKHSGWTRKYRYSETSQLEPAKQSNRLSTTSVGSSTEVYHYDGDAGLHGNMTSMPHLPMMKWDFKDQLQATASQVVNNGGTPETTWYVYDATGQRVRKVTERQSAPDATPTRLKERIYLGGLDIFRKYNGDESQVTEEYKTVHIMDGSQRLALIETRTQGTDPGPAQKVRYQMSNHLGSAVLELDEQGQVVSYEEYTPFGATVYQAVSRQTDLPKRYRYCGMERDDESGFQYHGSRYYAPWLGRWTACDPTGILDGLNLYAYVSNNPTQLHDPSGTEGKQPPKTNAKKKSPATPDIPAELTTKPGPQNASYKGHNVQVEYFPGTSGETILIVGGQHRSEPQGIAISKKLQAELQAARGKPGYYNIVFIPNLYENRPIVDADNDPSGRLVNGIDPNRNLPRMNESLEDAIKRGHGVPWDAGSTEKHPREINEENVILIALVEKFKPTRALQIHDKGSKPIEQIVKEGEAGTYVDPKVGSDPEDSKLIAREAVLEAKDKVGPRAVEGNLVTERMVKAAGKGTPGLRTRYPNGEAAQATLGVTFGEWGSHKGGMDVFLVEGVKNGMHDKRGPTDNLKWTEVIKDKYLTDPKTVRDNAGRVR
ncbi:hypothetical protein GJ744_010538 [Endocarpon pusillum]|uniref:Uncharacterized protein n=1 Tax=Endocarpon pusillum TaxID=364733 RepID=A0A8H7AUE3_9EURO|nr:hypothetical protein GJ744_010538 [Endocarpon pusillum]